MSITILGPDWPTVRALRTACATLPEEATWQFGGPKLDAIEQLTKLLVAGVPVPDFTQDPGVVLDWIENNDIVLGRMLRHSRGSDIVPFGHKRFATSEWWSRWVDSLAEWRIHVLRGAVIARGLKVLTGTPRRYHRNLPNIRSRRDGWTLRHDVPPPEEIRSLARSAVKVVGYDHGAVDILQTSANPATGVVLEVNLLPAMDAYTLGRYVRRLQALAARGKL